jgi:hypothetical protein
MVSIPNDGKDQPNLPGPVFAKPVDWTKSIAEIEAQLNGPDEPV